MNARHRRRDGGATIRCLFGEHIRASAAQQSADDKATLRHADHRDDTPRRSRTRGKPEEIVAGIAAALVSAAGLVSVGD